MIGRTPDNNNNTLEKEYVFSLKCFGNVWKSLDLLNCEKELDLSWLSVRLQTKWLWVRIQLLSVEIIIIAEVPASPSAIVNWTSSRSIRIPSDAPF